MERGAGRDRVLTSGWYAANIGRPCVPVEDVLGDGPLHRALARTRLGRGLLVYLAARASAGAAVRRTERGTLTALALNAAFGGARIVVLELIPDRPARPGWRRPLKRAWFRTVERPAVRRGMAVGHVLSRAERDDLATRFGVSPSRIEHVPFALTRTGALEPRPTSEREGVLASGRAACDWETLFAAAAGSTWSLTVVCGAEHRARVEALNADQGARVFSEISRLEHDRLMEAAAVFAMPLHDDGLSAGQVRLMTATELGTPVITSRVRTLADYVVEGETAVVVAPGDPAAFRAAIDSALADPTSRRRIADAALRRGQSRTYADYFADVGSMLERVLGTERGAESEAAHAAAP